MVAPRPQRSVKWPKNPKFYRFFQFFSKVSDQNACFWACLMHLAIPWKKKINFGKFEQETGSKMATFGTKRIFQKFQLCIKMSISHLSEQLES